ncbi:aminotransferase class I/II-fold pyridoxal phosphate-dependent enzyme [Sediminispirochaeta bajacaliforniensis]|uniref:aminotransferase class I/II-fold pyridoxal phosphate-dependent enzyme n=1 Tax=Sediminispirochaeta bajacaliforniensis TaxID=148 RepID=UPI00035D0986|nr:aminotransferase class I/II-fold pyridoxal phosphate-dependent enzyme [Sediminispirochaeta bajacaliforniensis]
MNISSERAMKPIFEPCHEYREADQARESGLYPFFRPIEAYRGSKVVIEGRELFMAGSNNYLGLALDPRLKEAAEAAVRKYGTSCSGSRFMNGTLDLHEELEGRLASFVGRDSAICFTTGYQTNLGAISALAARGAHVISDKYNHASIMDGIFLARGLHREVTLHRYRHNNLEDLEGVLSKLPVSAPKLLVTDGVFSMEGDIAPLPQLKAIADTYGAALYLDEAHAIGVVGETGRGTCEYYGDSLLTDLTMCTFSKAFGSIGGFVAGDRDIIDYIRHFARPLIFSASMPPSNVAAALEALTIIQTEPERIHRLQQIARKMLDGFTSLGFEIGTASTPIIPLIIGDNEKTFMFWKALFERGIYVNPVISPAVPPNRALIRTSYMSIHTDAELDMFLDIAEEEAKKLHII